jgi:hypothetical protein
MAGGFKYDHPPLLGPGRHCLSLSDIEHLCVKDFQASSTRQKLFDSLGKMVNDFNGLNIPCDMLLDGSFFTEKIDPKDVDVAVRIDVDFHDTLNQIQNNLIDLANTESYIDGIDSYVYVAYPRDHPLYNSGIDEKETWAEMWGCEHSKKWLKGLAILRLGESDVGLRIRRQ